MKDYSFYTQCKNECYKKFGAVFDLPLIRNQNEYSLQFLDDGFDVLDLGAGNSLPFKKILDSNRKKVNYYSLDNDVLGCFDFGNVDDIPSDVHFDFVIANQFFEHLTINEALELLVRLKEHLKKNAVLIITVPNIQHPVRYIADIDHKTPWGYKELYFLMRTIGLQVESIVAYSKNAPKGMINRFLIRRIESIYRMDWRDSVLAVGRNA